MNLKNLIDNIEGYRVYDPFKHEAIENAINELLQSPQDLPPHEQQLLPKVKAQWDAVSKAAATAHYDATNANNQLYAERAQKAFNDIDFKLPVQPKAHEAEQELMETQAFQVESPQVLKDFPEKQDSPEATSIHDNNQAVATTFKASIESQSEELSSDEPEKSPNATQDQEIAPDKDEPKKPRLK